MPVQDGPMLEEQTSFEAPVPAVSPLLAMGTSGPRISGPWKIALGGVAVAILLLATFILSLSAQFFLPEQTFFFATISPHHANALLTQKQISTLPARWQQALSTQSRWPVLFGLSYTTDPTSGQRETRAYTLGPRWAIPPTNTDIQTRLLVRQSGALLNDSSFKQGETRYRSTLIHHIFSTGALQGRLDPASIFSHASSGNRIAFYLDDETLALTDAGIPLSSQESSKEAHPITDEVPHQADLSLHVAALGDRAYVDELLAELPLHPIQTTLMSLEQPLATLEASFASSTNLETVRLIFQEPLASNAQRALIAHLNQTQKRRVFTLPDGTLGTEEVVDTSKSESNSTVIAPSTSFEWRATTSTSESFDKAAICGHGTWIARFSSNILRRLLPKESDMNVWIPPNGLQIWRNGTQLHICRES